jgi:hypothetical protein
MLAINTRILACFRLVRNRCLFSSDDKVTFSTISVALVGERTIPTERPPLVGVVSANF